MRGGCLKCRILVLDPRIPDWLGLGEALESGLLQPYPVIPLWEALQVTALSFRV